MNIENHGQIESMSIPEGWVEAPPGRFTGIGTRSLREFYPPEAPDVRLCLFYRGLPVSEDAADEFRAILGQPDHELSAGDLASIEDIVRERADPGVFEAVRPPETLTFNGRRVLLIEGVYKSTNMSLREILVDADGTGRVVQEIYFVAPAEEYSRYVDLARNSFESISWKAAVGQAAGA